MKSPAFSLYVRDFLCGKTVSKLHSKSQANPQANGKQNSSGLLARGLNAYVFLLCESWLETPRATLPDDDEELAFLARVTPEEWSAIKPILMTGFVKDATTGRLYSERLMHESNKQAIRKQSGSKGGSKTQANRRANTQATLENENEDENAIAIEEENKDLLFPIENVTPEEMERPWQPTATQARFNALFHRKPTTRWSEKEIKALRAIEPIADDDIAIIERYYRLSIPKDKDYRRRDMLTLLNNFNGEVDRARRFNPSTHSVF